ncbi:MAG: hypothetical protein V3V49_00485, partial [Candidatus Krumholzibacteria bacterium]
RTVCLGGLFTLLSIVSAASGDAIGLFADDGGMDCQIIDDEPGVLNIFVVHTAPDGATASAFSAPMPACMVGATYLSDTCPFLCPGNSQTGTSRAYGGCLSGTIHVLTMSFFVQGTSEPCCAYPVLPHPELGLIIVEDCDGNPIPAQGAAATVNGDATCPCQAPVPVEATTWGAVKALYAD